MLLLFIQIRGFFVLGMAFLLVLSMTAVAKTYRWIDANGKVYYSHNIPPSAAQNGHVEMNEKSGRILNDIASRSEREKERQRALLLKAQEEQRQSQVREELSLQLFSSRTEVVKHFERRLEMVSVNLRLLQYHKRRLLKEITKIQQNASNVKTRKARRKTSRRLQKLQSTLLEHTRAIENNQQEQTMTSNNKKRALSRYNESTETDKSNGLDILIAGGNDKAGCSCVCDANKSR